MPSRESTEGQVRRSDPQVPMTVTAWALAMRRKAAGGRLRTVSESQSHKIGCRPAVGRVRRQSTLRRKSLVKVWCHEAASRTPRKFRPHPVHLSQAVACSGQRSPLSRWRLRPKCSMVTATSAIRPLAVPDVPKCCAQLRFAHPVRVD